VQKAEFGARMLMDLVQNKTGAGAAADTAEPTRLESPLPEMQRNAAAFAKPIRFDMNASQDTLNPEDREEAWSGPDSAGT
jgi:hypothetical protein